MSDEYVTVNDLADELGRDRSNFLKYVKKIGVTPDKRRPPNARGQETSTVSLKVAESIRKKFKEDGFSDSNVATKTEVGFFYIIQPDPELRPNELKFGFAGNVDTRLKSHRTIAPRLKKLKSWPCKDKWEHTVIDALASVGGRLISTEIFEFPDVDAVLERADELFELLPDPAAKIPVVKEP